MKLVPIEVINKITGATTTVYALAEIPAGSIGGGGTSTTTDNTLTLEGVPADAAAVGYFLWWLYNLNIENYDPDNPSFVYPPGYVWGTTDTDEGAGWVDINSTLETKLDIVNPQTLTAEQQTALQEAIGILPISEEGY